MSLVQEKVGEWLGILTVVSIGLASDEPRGVVSDYSSTGNRQFLQDHPITPSELLQMVMNDKVEKVYRVCSEHKREHRTNLTDGVSWHFAVNLEVIFSQAI